MSSGVIIPTPEGGKVWIHGVGPNGKPVKLRCDSQGRLIVRAVSEWRIPPASPHNDDDEFDTDNIGTWATGNFWEWVTAPSSWNVNKTLESHLCVRQEYGAARAVLKGKLSPTGRTFVAASIEMRTESNRHKNAQFYLKLYDSSTGHWCGVRVRDDSTNGWQIQGVHDVGAGEVASSPHIWGDRWLPPVVLEVRQYNTATARYFRSAYSYLDQLWPWWRQFGFGFDIVSLGTFTADEVRLEFDVGDDYLAYFLVDFFRRTSG